MTNMSDTKSDRDLITAEEAKVLFEQAGLSPATFYRKVERGLIQKMLPPERERGALYPRSQVIAAIESSPKAKSKLRKKRTIPITPTIFSQATIQDMPEMAVLLETFYNAKISVEKRGAWIERNPEVTYILRHEGKLIGCAFILPLTEEKIMNIFANQVKPATLPHEIFLYEPNKPFYLYVRSVGVLQSVSKRQRRHWAARLIAELANVVVELGARGIIIKKIYAQGDTKAGERALKSIGFMQINSITRRKNYMLDITESGSPFVIRYREALEAWQSQNTEE